MTVTVTVPVDLSWNMHEKMEKGEPALGAPLQRGGGLEKGIQGPPTPPNKFFGSPSPSNLILVVIRQLAMVVGRTRSTTPDAPH